VEDAAAPEAPVVLEELADNPVAVVAVPASVKVGSLVLAGVTAARANPAKAALMVFAVTTQPV
jgi:hypothetical protein